MMCDKPISPLVDKKYATMHEKCMKAYLKEFGDKINKNVNEDKEK